MNDMHEPNRAAQATPVQASPDAAALLKSYAISAALFSGFAFANPGIAGSKTASAASFIISRRFISDLAFKDATEIFPEPDPINDVYHDYIHDIHHVWSQAGSETRT